MNEKQTIEKIKLLKTIQPKRVVLDDIKKGVYQKAGVEFNPSTKSLQKFLLQIYQPLRSYQYFSFGVTVAVVIVFTFVLSFFLPQAHMLLLKNQVFFAPNRYEGAKIAVSDVTSRYDKTSNTSGLSQELAFTNTQMSALKLKGENGKYTQSQCQALYQQYLAYLNHENASLPNQPQFISVKTQILTYQEQAEQKLHKYSRM